MTYRRSLQVLGSGTSAWIDHRTMFIESPVTGFTFRNMTRNLLEPGEQYPGVRRAPWPVDVSPQKLGWPMRERPRKKTADSS